MQTHMQGGKAILAQIMRPYGRTLLFESLFLHHDEVSEAAGRRLEWSRLYTEFAKAGLTGADEKPANAITGHMTWWHIRKKYARIEALRAAKPAEREKHTGTNSRQDTRAQVRSPDAKASRGGRDRDVQMHARGGSAILAQVERPYERSSLFEWLMTHHDEMVAAAGGRRIEWSRLCAEFAKVGLTGADRKPANAATARKTWQRVRKERARIEVLHAAERAERGRLSATNARRNMPSQFPKGDYLPLLATAAVAAGPKVPTTTFEQASRGLQLSTAQGVVVTRVSRVFKTERATDDYVFKEDGMIAATTARASALKGKQQLNVRGGRPINDLTEDYYTRLGLRSEAL
jgi:hypothetical protein